LGFGVVKNKNAEKPNFLAMENSILSVFRGIAEDFMEILPVFVL